MGEVVTAEEGACPKRADGTHCEHWWDGDVPCCACGFAGPSELDKATSAPYDSRSK